MQTNRILIKTLDGSTVDVMQNAGLSSLINRDNIVIEGENNTITLSQNGHQSIEDVLTQKGLYIRIYGSNNTVDLGKIGIVINPVLGAYGLMIMIGNAPCVWTDGSHDKDCSNCSVKIGDGTALSGLTVYLQDDDSAFECGGGCMISWGVDMWCSDIHTILSADGSPSNIGRSIHIGSHCWIGKDVKIGKNTFVADDSIVGWGTVVTKRFEDRGSVIAGIPGKLLRTGVRWDSRCINNYLKDMQ